MSLRNDGVLLLAGGEVLGQSDTWARFAVIVYDSGKFVFSARQYDDDAVSSCICQLQQQGLLIIQLHSAECTTLYSVC